MLRRRTVLRLASLFPALFVSRFSIGAEPEISVSGHSAFHFSGAARRIGEVYLKQFPEASNSRAHLDLPEDRTALKNRIEADFGAGDIVILKGWVLSRTECLVCVSEFLEGNAVDVR